MTLDDCAGPENALARVGLVFAGVAVALQTVLFLVNIYVLPRRLWLLELDEGYLITWVTSVATFSTGLLAFLLSFLVPSEKMRCRAIALGTAFISFDDATFLHERISYRIADALEVSRTYILVIWPPLYLPLLAVVAILLFQTTSHDRRARRLCVTGLGALVAGVALEVAGLALRVRDVPDSAWQWTFQTVLEEGAETGGWILIATAFAVRLLTAMRDPRVAGV